MIIFLHFFFFVGSLTFLLKLFVLFYLPAPVIRESDNLLHTHATCVVHLLMKYYHLLPEHPAYACNIPNKLFAGFQGFFLMTAYPQSQMDKHRSTIWQFFFPTVDSMLTNHYSEQSSVNRTISILYIVMLNLRRTTPGGHTVGKYIIKTLLW